MKGKSLHTESCGDKRLEVVLATNASGVMYTHIAIVSLLESLFSRHNVRVTVLGESLGQAEIEVLRGTANGFDFAEIRIIDAMPAMEPFRDILDQKWLRRRWPMAMWARCFVDVLLPDVKDCILYIDTDVFVADDIRKLLEIQMEGYVFAAMPESVLETSKGADGRFQRLKLPDDFVYFNSGVMVFNMAEYRALGGSRRIVELLSEYGDKIKAPDQDVLNILANGRVKPLHPRWNYNDGWLDRQFQFSLVGERRFHGLKTFEILEAILNPGIIHYKGSRKPWRENHRPERKRYEAIMRRLGYLKNGSLLGSTCLMRAIVRFFDIYHVILRQIVRVRLVIWRMRLGRLVGGVMMALFAAALFLGGIAASKGINCNRPIAEKSSVRYCYDVGTVAPPRIIFTPDIPNLRDIGGWRTCDGGRVKFGKVFRSGEFNSIKHKWSVSANTREYISGYLGVRTELDLREAKQIGDKQVSPLGEGVRLVNVPAEKYADIATEQGAAALVEALRLLLDERNLPVVVHCQAGVDRAGSFVFVLNGLLGVSEEDLRRDWILSSLWFSFVEKDRNGCFEELLGVADKYPGATLQDRLTTFVVKHGFSEDDVLRLRTIFTERPGDNL